MFPCQICGKTYTFKTSMYRHIRSKGHKCQHDDEPHFKTSNRFDGIQGEKDDIRILQNDYCEDAYDRSDRVKERALSSLNKDVHIVSERKSYDPENYRIFELSNGTSVNVPIRDERTYKHVIGASTNRLLQSSVTNFPPMMKKLGKKSSTSQNKLSSIATTLKSKWIKFK